MANTTTDFSVTRSGEGFEVSAHSAAGRGWLAEKIGAGAVGFTAAAAGFAKFVGDANAAGLVVRMQYGSTVAFVEEVR